MERGAITVKVRGLSVFFSRPRYNHVYLGYPRGSEIGHKMRRMPLKSISYNRWNQSLDT